MAPASIRTLITFLEDEKNNEGEADPQHGGFRQVQEDVGHPPVKKVWVSLSTREQNRTIMTQRYRKNVHLGLLEAIWNRDEHQNA